MNPSFTRFTWIFTVAVALWSICNGCSAAKHRDGAPQSRARSNGLRCELAVASQFASMKSFAARATITNSTSAPIDVEPLSIESEPLALEFEHEGSRFHAGPPPMPPEHFTTVTVAPGQTLTESFDNVPIEGAGHYRVRFICPGARDTEDWHEFVVSP